MKPEKTIKWLTFYPIPEFSDAALAFGARESEFFSRYDTPDVPGKYEALANELFFRGGEPPAFMECIEREKALRAITAWLRSFAPAHEAKIATVGYALWLWSEMECAQS